MSSPLRGRALITGGSAGIGYAFATALAKRGCSLLLVARNADRLERAAQELRSTYGVDVQVQAADLGDRDQADRVAQRLLDEDDPIDILVNNAGSGLHDKLAEPDIDAHLTALDLMVRAVLVLGTRAAHAMKQRGRGVIINVGSVAGLLPLNHYSAIKAWVNTFSESMSLELEGTGVRVVTLVPGWVRTEFHQRAKIGTSAIPDRMWLDADDLIADALAAADKGRSWEVPSTRYKAIAVLTRVMPRAIVRRACRMIARTRT
ncbi:MAG: SDR family NAD(P)-dependent oxidoreductase [Beutenbergiaceae bacterium]